MFIDLERQHTTAGTAGLWTRVGRPILQHLCTGVQAKVAEEEAEQCQEGKVNGPGSETPISHCFTY